jgi:hypothetical protein
MYKSDITFLLGKLQNPPFVFFILFVVSRAVTTKSLLVIWTSTQGHIRSSRSPSEVFASYWEKGIMSVEEL